MNIDEFQAPLRINVVGTSGSGKSVFARELARRLGARYICMDELFWLPNWQQPTDEVFFAKIEAALAEAPRWVIDGNYGRTQPIKWREEVTVIWLDYSFPLTFWRALKRAVSRLLSREELWPGTGNRESIRQTFFSRKSILLWTIQTHPRMRARYEALLAAPPAPHLRFVRLRGPREARAYLRGLGETKRH